MPEMNKIVYREQVTPKDREAVGRLVRTTGFFSEEEVGIAAELVDERLAKGEASGYSFLFAEEEGQLLGYTCFGPIPGSVHSCDLYWIAVAPNAQGMGLGKKLMAGTDHGGAQGQARLRGHLFPPPVRTDPRFLPFLRVYAGGLPHRLLRHRRREGHFR
jgi:ribosomal protein S18 acetylase RimI-like enzyme